MTRFASEGGGWSDYAADQDDGKDASYWAVVIDVRNWPANQPRTLVDFSVGLQACETRLLSNGFHACDDLMGTKVFTPGFQSIQKGKSGWTSSATTANTSNIDGMRINLNAILL